MWWECSECGGHVERSRAPALAASAERRASSSWPPRSTTQSLAIPRWTACEPSGCAPVWNRFDRHWSRKVSKHQRSAEVERAERSLDLSHLRRDARTALELAVVALAPTELIDRLAAAAGLLEALAELPTDSAPVIALLPALVARTRGTLEDWQKWQAQHLESKMPRG